MFRFDVGVVDEKCRLSRCPLGARRMAKDKYEPVIHWRARASGVIRTIGWFGQLYCLKEYSCIVVVLCLGMFDIE
jgi:hypothetical protein